MLISTCMVRPSFLMRSLPSLVHGAGSSSSRFNRYLQTKKPDLPLSGQYLTTLKESRKQSKISEDCQSYKDQSTNQQESFSVPAYLIYAIISVSFLWRVFTVLATLAAAHNSDRLASLPILCLGPIFVIDRNIAVESQRPDQNQINCTLKT